MLIRTHLAITLFFALILISIVKEEYRILFIILSLIATYIPDIDTKFSTLGKKKPLRIIQFFVKHRGIIHSFTFLLLITILLVLFLPAVSLGFFLGYSLHLLADSFTLTGIRFFYPFKKTISGKIKTGGKIETGIFMVFLIADLVLIFWKISGLF